MEHGRTTPKHLAEMAGFLLAHDDFPLRLFVQAWLREQPRFAAMPQPETSDPRIRTVAAALIELLAERAGQPPPAWTAAVDPLPAPFFVMRQAARPGFTRDLCLHESPEPLRQRNIFAPPNFLEMA